MYRHWMRSPLRRRWRRRPVPQRSSGWCSTWIVSTPWMDFNLNNRRRWVHVPPHHPLSDKMIRSLTSDVNIQMINPNMLWSTQLQASKWSMAKFKFFGYKSSETKTNQAKECRCNNDVTKEMKEKSGSICKMNVNFSVAAQPEWWFLVSRCGNVRLVIWLWCLEVLFLFFTFPFNFQFP